MNGVHWRGTQHQQLELRAREREMMEARNDESA